MSIEILKQPTRIQNVEYNLIFDRRDDPHSGCWFPCDSDGVIDPGFLNGDNLAGLENYRECLKSEKYQSPRVERLSSFHYTPRVGRCFCGSRLELPDFTNQCRNCDRYFNSFGQQLSDPFLLDEY